MTCVCAAVSPPSMVDGRELHLERLKLPEDLLRSQ